MNWSTKIIILGLLVLSLEQAWEIYRLRRDVSACHGFYKGTEELHQEVIQ